MTPVRIADIISPLVLIAGCLGMALMLIEIIGRYPDNHAAGVMMYRWLFLGVLIAAGICMIWKNNFARAALILAFIGFGSTWIIDHRNILVDYEVWAERGMPGWGQRTPDND